METSHPRSFETNVLHPGFFQGASGIDARHGIYNEVAGNQYFNYNVELPEIADNLILDKLPHVKTAGHRSGNHGTCLNGTREAELRYIREWEVDYTNRRVYWLCGVAGSGKSTIAQTFAEHSSSNGRLGASFFCSRDFEDRRNIRLIFPTLAYQLAYHHPEFRAYLVSVIKSNPDIGYESLELQLKELLVVPLQSTGISATIIIDALDECEDKEPASAILSLLARYIDEIPFVKFFITGRPELPIRSGFRLPLLRPHTEVLLLHEGDRVSVDQDIALYLTTRLSETVKRRSHCDIPTPWPTEREIAIITRKCSGLFIIAFIITEFVDDPNETPQDRLDLLLSIPDDSIHGGKSRIDLTYHQVFVASFKHIDEIDPFFNRLRLIVGFILLAFNPLSCASLARILDMSSERIWVTLRSLHSILVIPDEDTHPIRMCHKSLADYLTDQRRCTDAKFYIDPSVYHLEFATYCLGLMNRELRRNICDLPPYVMNQDILDLDVRREECIGAPLEYACRSWAKHLRFSSGKCAAVGDAIKALSYFIENHLLSWLEVLSITRDLRTAIQALRDVQVWLVEVDGPPKELIDKIKDCERFVLRFFDAIEASAPHIYHSAFLWAPETSFIRKIYRNKLKTDVRVLNGVDASWDASIRTIRTNNGTCAVEFSHRGDLVATGGRQGCVQVFEASTGVHSSTLFGHKYPVKSVAFSPDDTFLASGSWDFDVRIWDLQTGGLVRRLEGHTSAVWSVAFSPCGTKIASCAEDGTIRVWHTDVSLKCCEYVLDDSGWPLAVCWSATGTAIISGSDDGTVKIWDASTQSCSKTLEGHTDSVLSVRSSEYSSLIASGSRDSTVNLYDAETGELLRTIMTIGHVHSVRFLPDGKHLVYATLHLACVFDLFTNLDVSVYTCDGKQVAFSPDGHSMVSGADSDAFVTVMQTKGRDPGGDKAGYHSGSVVSIRFASDGHLLASIGSSELKLWDIATGSCLSTFPHAHHVGSVSFSPNSLLVASTNKDAALIRSVQGHRVIWTLKSEAGPIVGLAFSPDSSQLVTVSHLGSIRLWDAITGELLAHRGDASQRSQVRPRISFSAHGTSIVVSDMIWRIASVSVSAAGTSSGRLPLAFTRSSDKKCLPDVLPQRYRLLNGGEWVLDQQARRICWVPPDRRSRLTGTCQVHGNMVALGSMNGKVTILDFSDAPP